MAQLLAPSRGALGGVDVDARTAWLSGRVPDLFEERAFHLHRTSAGAGQSPRSRARAGCCSTSGKDGGHVGRSRRPGCARCPRGLSASGPRPRILPIRSGPALRNTVVRSRFPRWETSASRGDRSTRERTAYARGRRSEEPSFSALLRAGRLACQCQSQGKTPASTAGSTTVIRVARSRSSSSPRSGVGGGRWPGSRGRAPRMTACSVQPRVESR